MPVRTRFKAGKKNSLLIKIINFFLFISFFTDPNYFFTQTSGRFVQPPAFQNPRNGFFPASSLSALPANQQRTAPGTYQEQTLYGVNERPEEDTTPDYLQFSAFPVCLTEQNLYFNH